MKQPTLAMAADQGFERYLKPTRRDQCLETRNRIVPWEALCAVVEPRYPKRASGLQPIGLERMLRNHFPQHWLNLAHPACERALYGSASLCCLAGIDLGREAVPDATSLLRFRHSLERHQPGRSCSPKRAGCYRAAA